MNIFRVLRPALSGLAFVSVLPFLGCAGGSTDVSVRIPEAERPDLDAGAPENGRRVVPMETGFNISKYSSGQDGRNARGVTEALDQNGARCRAVVTDEGSAWGAFQLGYTFDNMTGKPLSAVVRLKAIVKASVDAKAVEGANVAAPKTQATGAANVTFVLKDTLGLVLRQETLYSSSIGSGPREASRQHDIVFDARLEPGRGYYLVLAGRADAGANKGQSAEVNLRVSDISMEIEWRAVSERAEAPTTTLPAN